MIATGRCASGLDAAVPAMAHWDLAPLPRYLPPQEVERLLYGLSFSHAEFDKPLGTLSGGQRQKACLARALLARAFEDRERQEVTVNAAPGSVEAYARLGFRPAGPWATINGLTFQPMVRRGAPAKPG